MRRFTRLTLLTGATVFVAATPAGAAPLLANEQYKWFYWAGPILFASFLAMCVGLGVMYVRRIVIPRQRGRRVE